MKDWKAASQFIRRRSASSIYEGLAVAAPFTFSADGTPSETSAFLDANWSDLEGEHNSIMSLPARDMNFVTDALIAVCKFWHVVGCARSNAARGALTWTMVDAYHACLLGGRALLALHGILSYSMRGRTLLVDFRPELGSVDDAKNFIKANRNVQDPIRVLQPQCRQLEQKDGWNLLTRLGNVIPAADRHAEAMKAVSAFASRPLSQTRNTIIYDSVFWVWRADFKQRVGSIEFQDDLSSVDEVVQGTVHALEAIFALSEDIVADLCKNIGLAISELSEFAGTGARALA